MLRDVALLCCAMLSVPFPVLCYALPTYPLLSFDVVCIALLCFAASGLTELTEESVALL